MNDERISKTYKRTKCLNIQLKHITIYNGYLPNKNSGFIKKSFLQSLKIVHFFTQIVLNDTLNVYLYYKVN